MSAARTCCALVAAIAIALAAADASTAAVMVLDPAGSEVSAYGGWAAWTHVDATPGEYALMLRSPAGAVSVAPVPPGNGPFHVEVGPGPSGVEAVYQRCSDPAHSRGCHVVALALGGATSVEHQLPIPGGGSDFMPAIWKSSVAFARLNPSGGSRRPENLYLWSIGSRVVRTVKLPVSRGGREPEGGHWPKGLTGAITCLTVGAAQLAFVTSNLNGTFGETTLWYEPIGAVPELIDQETSGAGNVCPPAFLSPLLAGGWLYAYLHACDPSANPALDRLTRYRRGEAERAAYSFIHVGDDGIGSAVIDGGGVDWDAAGVERVAPVSWKRIALPVAQTFCTRAYPFC
jgi:hypothetical protein